MTTPETPSLPLGLITPLPPLFTKFFKLSFPPLEPQRGKGYGRACFVHLRMDGVLAGDIISAGWCVPRHPSIELVAASIKHDHIVLTASTMDPDVELPTEAALVIATVTHPGWTYGRPLSPE